MDLFSVERADALAGGKGCASHDDPACLCDVDLSGHEPVEIRFIPPEFADVETAQDLFEAAALLVTRHDLRQSWNRGAAEISEDFALALIDQHWRGTLTQSQFAQQWGTSLTKVREACAKLGLPWVMRPQNVQWRQERAYYIFLRESGMAGSEALKALHERFPATVRLHRSTVHTWWLRHRRSMGEAA